MRNLKKKIVRSKTGVFKKGTKVINIRCREKNGIVDIYRFWGEGQKDQLEPAVCSVFCCPNNLTPQEQLFGDRCQQHQKKETTLSIIDKILSH